MLLELGGGVRPHPDAEIVLDTRYPKNAPAQDIAVVPWRGFDGPIPDDSVHEVYASHLMEHIPRGEPLLALMNEAWRVLEPGGFFTMLMPLVGYTLPSGEKKLVASWEPYADPTHVNFWWLPEALGLYYCQPDVWAAMYDVRPWAPMGPYIPEESLNWMLPTFWSVRQGWEGIARIRKP